MNLHNVYSKTINIRGESKVEKKLKIEGYELLSQKAYQVLKNEIVRGILEPGSKLSENKLAKEMQISRTPIREAMRNLTAEGLVKTSPNKKIIVSEVSLADIKEVLQVRGALEGLAASISAKKISHQEIEKLEKIFTRMSSYADKKHLSYYCEVDDEFHNLILTICGNKWIIKVRENLGNFIYRFRFKSLSVSGRLKCSLEEHRAIMESLKKHNSEEADRLSRLHMENTIINILRNVA